uniref:Uncharacterized protein n=1 Tax=Lotus japonicus TaxID=34305 RepID=I3T527_LOTJA|nr:unknown [Lotus japonicus]
MPLIAFSASISDSYDTKPNPLGLFVFGSNTSVASVTAPNGENSVFSCSFEVKNDSPADE